MAAAGKAVGSIGPTATPSSSSTGSGRGQEASTYYSGPLQLIRIDDNGKCHLQENAVAILNQIQGRLAVVGIAGLYRTGKSFLLNRLLGLQEGFEIGPSVNPCTKGLWIWGQPVQLAADYHCILIDTEGLGSTQRTASCDMQIFSLCILLSSYFIYNSMGAIDEAAIDDLHLVLNLAKHIHVRSRKGGEVERPSELATYFPIFLWVLRDFHLRLVDGRGAPISERDYLENSLRPIAGQEQKNGLREAVKDLFRDRDCVTIVRPVAEESDLRNIQALPYDSLRPQFRSQIEAFVKKVYLSLKPKKLDGALVNGSMFVNLASEYCKAINNSVVPTIQSAWTSVVQHQLRLCLKDAVQCYRSQMNDKAMQHLPMAEDQLRDLHKAAKAQALQVFLAPKFEATDGKFREHRAELASRVKQLFEHVKAENQSTSLRQCERYARELYSRQIENKLGVKGSYQNFEQLMQDWDFVRKSYMQKTAGPGQVTILSTWMFERMTESLQRLWEELRGSLDDRHAAMHRKLVEAEANSLSAHDDRAKQSDGIEVVRRQWLAEKIDLERQLEDVRRSAEEASMRAGREKAQLMDSERTLREQMRLLQEQLKSSVTESSRNARMDATAAATAELHSLRDAVVAMMSEVKGIDTEKRQLEMKAEHEKQLIGLERKFQRQLMEARRKNEGLIESLRQTYEDEVDGLKNSRNDLVAKNKDLEKELERARGEVELLRQRMQATESQHALQRRFVENAQRQSELVMTFLEGIPGRGGKDLTTVREELSVLTGTPTPSDSQLRRGSDGGRSPGMARGGGGAGGGNAGNMPYASANAAVFRSMPGV